MQIFFFYTFYLKTAQILRERLSLVLIGLLPLHALLLTFATKIFHGQNMAPLRMFAIWKEVLLLVILGIALWEIFQKIQEEGNWRAVAQADRIDTIIIAFVLLLLVVTAAQYNGPSATLYGIKYDLVPLVLFCIARRVSWSTGFSAKAIRVLLGIGIVLALYGLCTLFLPMSFFTALGYSDLHSLYVPNNALPAFQQIGASGIRRIQSTMSGPNQFGLWLLLPFSISLLGLIRCIQSDDNFFFRVLNIAQTTKAAFWTYASIVLLLSSTIILTFSRTAWLSAFLIVILAVFMRYSSAIAQKYIVRLLAPFIFGFAILAILAPNIVFRAHSTKDHILKPMLGIQHMVLHPFGSGLGSAGPAHNRISDACVFLPEKADASWAADRPSLCVYTGDTQVQPVDRICQCPFVTENWYIQIGVELGIFGLLLFAYIIFLLMQQLRSATDEAHSAVLFAFFGISIAGMFLHSWESAAVAYTLWLLLAVQLRVDSNTIS